jgi:hypothetical protein
MTTREIADRLAELCAAGRYRDAITELYAPDVTQQENGQPIPGARDALVAACKGWEESRVVHGTEILGVHVAPDAFVIEMRHDVDLTASNRECVYVDVTGTAVRFRV